jgi:VWFA-related protein
MWHRHRFVALLVLLVFVAAAGLAAPARAQNDALRVAVTQVDGSRFPLVTIYLSVTDKDSKPAVGLTEGQLAVTEDGQTVEIVEFKGSGGVPVSTLLILDRSDSMAGPKIAGAQQAAQTFVKLMRPQDQAGLLLFAATSELAQPLTSDTARLQQSLEAIRLAESTALYDAILSGLDTLQPVSGRKSAIVLSDGQDNRDSWLARFAGYGSQHTLEQTVAQAASSGVTLYTIGLGQQSEINEPALQQLAARTGGTYYHAPSADQLAELYRSLAQQFQTEYAITYRSPRATYDGTRRNIQVTINAEGGQAGSSSGTYLERHLLQLHSSPLGGLTLSGLLLLALAGPLALRRRAHRLPQPIVSKAAPETPAPADVSAAAERTCGSCGARLRATAQFCARCGREQR